MHLQHIINGIFVIICCQLLFLSLSMLLLKCIWVYEITQINLGVDKLISFRVKKIEINIGLSFFIGGNLKVAGNENGQISDKQNHALALCGIIAYAFLLGLASALSNENISILLKFICYYCFLIDTAQLKVLLYHFNYFNLFVGIAEIGLIWALINKLVISLPTTDRRKNILYTIAVTMIGIFYLRLMWGYFLH